MECAICPRKCGADREKAEGFCGVGDRPVVAKAYLHRWEEPCVSGVNGSGTVFFSGCNLKCVFCQNHTISHGRYGREITVEQLGQVFLSLQEKGAHNINLVSPTHFIAQIVDAFAYVKGHLEIPVVYNSNGYDTLEGLRLMEGIADVYLPDIKYFSREASRIYSGAPDYFETASSAVLEMYRQVGPPRFNEDGIIMKGLMIRHLIMPGLASESVRILDWIRENLPQEVYVSLMSQYTPCYKACFHPEINRRITRREYEKAVGHLYKLGLENGYVQERDSACEEYIPDFNLEGLE